MSCFENGKPKIRLDRTENILEYMGFWDSQIKKALLRLKISKEESETGFGDVLMLKTDVCGCTANQNCRICMRHLIFKFTETNR